MAAGCRPLQFGAMKWPAAIGRIFRSAGVCLKLEAVRPVRIEG
jgi:hypothetical protein